MQTNAQQHPCADQAMTTTTLTTRWRLFLLATATISGCAAFKPPRKLKLRVENQTVYRPPATVQNHDYQIFKGYKELIILVLRPTRPDPSNGTTDTPSCAGGWEKNHKLCLFRGDLNASLALKLKLFVHLVPADLPGINQQRADINPPLLGRTWVRTCGTTWEDAWRHSGLGVLKWRHRGR